ncbi:unnamed protein product [Bursaphelenchus okinawaensis]|uniref:UBC core domain-containing protein n=1 Tax=Bursaphelenchus okinawaensis TaxID=465554 RepID=A0A811JSY7_9BILA|nr:unnamed protein product [Bursaphelenchus okinawaensis]CAG9081592.1 unnamed protein product [Bursaphelenchus okinawaensis]
MDIPCGTIPNESPSIASSRLLAEANFLKENPIEDCEAFPQFDDIMKWTAVVRGPKGSYYEGGTFFFEMHFSKDYPHIPPLLVFLTRIYHPRINVKGEIDLPMLNQLTWNPCGTVGDVLKGVRALLMEKIEEDDDKQEETIAREWTKRFAC